MRLVLLLAITASSSCASYSEEMHGAQLSITSGDMIEAIRFLNSLLEVESEREVPNALDDHDTLLLLERATLLQAKNNFKMSARDMMAVDQRLEWFDIQNSSAKALASYFYSDSVVDYRAPAYERLLLNTLNMINFLGLHDLEGARVEARRFTIMEQFYLNNDGKSDIPGMLALGNYVSGVAFESSADYRRAVRYYTRAWMFGIKNEDLRRRLTDLIRLTNYKNRVLSEDTFARLVNDAREMGPISRKEYRKKHNTGDTLVVVQYGMVPYKRAVRMPATQALNRASVLRGRYALSNDTRLQASELISSGALNWVVLPELTSYMLPTRTTASASLQIDNKPVTLHLGMEVRRQVEAAWMEFVGPVMAASISRMITRAVIGAAGRAASSLSTSSGNGKLVAIGALGWLAATGAQAAMTAADVPDTRSWTTLPAYIRIGRVQLTQGLHRAEVNIDGRTDRQTLPVWPNRINLLNFSRLR